MTDTPTPPEGWYPDPAGSGGTRRWDGAAWTDEVRPADVRPVDDAWGDASDATPVSASTASEQTPSAGHAALAGEPASAVPPAPLAPSDPAIPPSATESSAPALAAAPGVTAPSVPAAPVAPLVPSSPAVPAGYPAYSTTPSNPQGSSFVPGHVAGPGAPAGTATKRDIPTDTVWVWLIVALPLVSLLMLFLVDWRSELEQILYAAVLAEQSGYSSSSEFVNFSLTSTLFSIGMSVFGLVLGALSVLFAFLDWRQLRARGIEKPFHWAWAFFVFLVTAGVYVIGRGVVLHRQTRKGLGPIWGFIAVTVVSLAVGAIWLVFLLRDIFAIMQQLMYTYSY